MCSAHELVVCVLLFISFAWYKRECIWVCDSAVSYTLICVTCVFKYHLKPVMPLSAVIVQSQFIPQFVCTESTLKMKRIPKKIDTSIKKIEKGTKKYKVSWVRKIFWNKFNLNDNMYKKSSAWFECEMKNNTFSATPSCFCTFEGQKKYLRFNLVRVFKMIKQSFYFIWT